VTPPVMPGATRFVTLSPYCPREDELTNVVLQDGTAWDLAMRGGWVGMPGAALRHATTTMVMEGSVLRRKSDRDEQGAEVYGQLLDVTPGPFTAHRVYRYGFAFPWPVA
jgi:CRISPR/Cas system CSM-associated protein Csm4 (group 5 of RAMP superfamily)